MHLYGSGTIPLEKPDNLIDLPFRRSVQMVAETESPSELEVEPEEPTAHT